jgi:hypothetical protein
MECRIRLCDNFKLLLHIQLLNVLNRLGWLTMFFCVRTHCNCKGALRIVLFVSGTTAPDGPWPPHSRGRTTVLRIPLDE